MMRELLAQNAYQFEEYSQDTLRVKMYLSMIKSPKNSQERAWLFSDSHLYNKFAKVFKQHHKKNAPKYI